MLSKNPLMSTSSNQSVRQHVFDHHLRDAIRYRRYPQWSRSPRRLWYLNTPNRWRHITARDHSVPEFVQVPRRFFSNSSID